MPIESSRTLLEHYLPILVQIAGRIALREERLREIVGDHPKYVLAYNLADGTREQKEIVQKSGIDQGSLSKTLTRWVESGAMFRLGEGKAMRFLHVYPLTAPAKKANAAKARR